MATGRAVSSLGCAAPWPLTAKDNFSTRLVLTFLWVFFALGLSANAANIGTSFTAQCPGLLAQADDFARDCLTNAREQRRVFYPVGPEVHSAYFREAAPGSHFALGCTLNVKRQIEFLGVYYALDGNNFKIANTAPLGFIDFQGNAGVVADGDLVNFIAVRQFGTDSIPLRYGVGGAKNCESLGLPEGELRGMTGGSFSASERRDGTSIWIRPCEGGACWPEGKYIEFLGDSDKSVVFHLNYYEFYIESGGGILVRREILQKFCPAYDSMRAKGAHPQADTVNLLGEICLNKNPVARFFY